MFFFIRAFLFFIYLTTGAITNATDKVASKNSLVRRYIWINGYSVAVYSEVFTPEKNCNIGKKNVWNTYISMI